MHSYMLHFAMKTNTSLNTILNNVPIEKILLVIEQVMNKSKNVWYNMKIISRRIKIVQIYYFTPTSTRTVSNNKVAIHHHLLRDERLLRRCIAQISASRARIPGAGLLPVLKPKRQLNLTCFSHHPPVVSYRKIPWNHRSKVSNKI